MHPPMKKQLKQVKLPLRTETVRTLTDRELTDVAGGISGAQTVTNPSEAKCQITPKPY